MTTLRQLFQAPFHTLPLYAPPVGGTGGHISGASTNATDPPRFATLLPHTHWTNLNTTFIGQLHANALTNEQVYLIENALLHRHEADVVRAAVLYILHPINQALSIHPQLVAAGINCMSEYTSNGIRSDITYYRNPLPGAGPDKRAFAVVEFKKRNIIDDDEFDDAVRVITQQPDGTVAAHSQAAYDQGAPYSFFEGDSLPLIKQASSYAIKHRTQYVALYNWDFLVLVRFTLNPAQTKAQLQINGVGTYCEMTVIPYAQSELVRPALLGFLWEAYQNTP